ncbi:hypothetical protein MUG87_06730 [Ectobacillus sp. JY-23]|uniref:hypothetical protein n=1 Tax=Ectobacillus sp. JY-23 TaxID=2933872 RepID=UPI001FF1376D|nr:hypothetical protein [Ectobacillus sp. JY-23]UOY93807.1 hypothetical protein MUG87_06730 [Ectobacillus sp. JY-23]
MYPYHYQPVAYRSAPVPPGDARFVPFFGFPFLAGIAGGLLGGALLAGPRPFYPPYPYAPYPCGPYPCAPVPYGPY